MTIFLLVIFAKNYIFYNFKVRSICSLSSSSSSSPLLFSFSTASWLFPFAGVGNKLCKGRSCSVDEPFTNPCWKIGSSTVPFKQIKELDYWLVQEKEWQNNYCCLILLELGLFRNCVVCCSLGTVDKRNRDSTSRLKMFESGDQNLLLKQCCFLWCLALEWKLGMKKRDILLWI